MTISVQVFLFESSSTSSGSKMTQTSIHIEEGSELPILIRIGDTYFLRRNRSNTYNLIRDEEVYIGEKEEETMTDPIEFGRALCRFLNLNPDEECITHIAVRVDFQNPRATIFIDRIADDWNKAVGQEITKKHSYMEFTDK